MTLRLHTWRRHVPVAGGLAMLLFALPACATPRSEARFDPPIERLAPRGARLAPPTATRTADGLALRGRVCGGGAALPPNRIRAERVAPTGVVTAAVSRPLPNLAYRGQPCAIYDLTARWTLAPDERLRLCATRGPDACDAPP